MGEAKRFSKGEDGPVNPQPSGGRTSPSAHVPHTSRTSSCARSSLIDTRPYSVLQATDEICIAVFQTGRVAGVLEEDRLYLGHGLKNFGGGPPKPLSTENRARVQKSSSGAAKSKESH